MKTTSDVLGAVRRSGATGVVSDSRDVVSGVVYVAINGAHSRGADFSVQAVEHGAKVVVLDDAERYDSITEQLRQKNVEASILLVENARKCLCAIIRYFGDVQSSTIVGVTGTNGKTSTAFFYMQLAAANCRRSASIGTLGVMCNTVDVPIRNFECATLKKSYAACMTTPDAVFLRQEVEALQHAGYDSIAIEMSSQGLDQYRVDHLDVTAIGFTNITHDHLDYHGNFANYFAAKERAFTEVLGYGGTAVLNADVGEFGELCNVCRMQRKDVQIISYGSGSAKDCDVYVEDTSHGVLSLVICGERYSAQCSMPMVQIQNLLCALSLGVACSLNVGRMVAAIPKLLPPSGRLEVVGSHVGGKIYVDYAHTPDALKVLLLNLRSELKLCNDVCGGSRCGRLGVVFGCGGQRDPVKRAIMGKIATDMADYVVITDDNPRNEDPALIRKAVFDACDKSKAIEISDRAKAIERAIYMMGEGDILAIAGKGHEDYQIVGDRRLYFSDKDEVQRVLTTLCSGDN